MNPIPECFRVPDDADWREVTLVASDIARMVEVPPRLLEDADAGKA